MNEHDDYSELIKQNKIIIALLGKIAFPDNKLKSMIQKKSKKPNEILKAYNLCNGELTITEIAKQSGIAQQSLSEAITKWEQLGIIMRTGSELKPLHLYLILEDEV